MNKHTSAHFSKRSIGSRGRLRLRSWRSVSEMVAIAKTVTWTASCLSYSRRRWVRGRRKNASMPFLACIARPGLTPNLALMGRRRTTLDLRGISELMVRPGAQGPRGRVMAAFGAARRVGQVGGASWASSQFNGSTGLLWRCRLTPEIQAASDDNSSGLPSAQCREREGVFRDSPAGAAAGRRRATEILVGGGTRARLHGAAVRRDPEYLD